MFGLSRRFIKKNLMRLFFPKSDIDLEEQFIREAIHFWRLTSLYNASHHTDDDMEKMQYTILRENHVIEKGMSMRNPRKGFGQEKVNRLISRLDKYFSLYGKVDKEFLSYPLSTIKTYITYTKRSGVAIDSIEMSFAELEAKLSPITIKVHGGVSEITREDIQSKCDKDFKSLLYSRHSIRYFSSEPVDKEKLIEALKLAQRTPSACNRQGWKTHVYMGDKSIKLAMWQGGCRGFEDEIRCSILVTANLKAFLSYEVHQAYIDGGLYAMNLINAIHSLGLGCIPLSCGFEYQKLEGLSQFGVPQNEVPIVIIGIGNLQEKFNVAISSRKDISKTNTFH